MKRKNLIITGLLVAFIILIGIISFVSKNKSKEKSKELLGMVMQYDENIVTVQDANSAIYTFNVEDADLDIGDNVMIEYTGLLNKKGNEQKCEVIAYTVMNETTDENGIPKSWSDNGIFSDYYKLAYEKLQGITLDEKIGQLLLVRYPSTNQKEVLKKYKLGGFVFFEKDFKDKTETEVKQMMNSLQDAANIPLLTAVDEEGGKVVRISSNPNLVSEKFKSSSELYTAGGFGKITQDTIDKSRVLYNLGLNLNLAPVVDVSTNPSDYMYNRTLKQNTQLTSTYAKTVIDASKGTGVSYTLKHFPGYGNNSDTHTGTSVDSRDYDTIVKTDLPPFEAGIQAGAEAVLVSHNIVNSIDSNNPASLSIGVHNLLRNQLAFTGIIISDDIAMGALSSIDDVTVKAILAGNDLIITTDYEESFNSIKNAITTGRISEEQINKLAFRVLAWKYYKLLMFANQK